MNRIPKVVPFKTAEEIKKQMAMPDLVFITKENEETMKEFICKSPDM